jgi:hypothetical protein
MAREPPVGRTSEASVRPFTPGWWPRPPRLSASPPPPPIGGGAGGPQPVGRRVVASRALAPPPIAGGGGGVNGWHERHRQIAGVGGERGLRQRPEFPRASPPIGGGLAVHLAVRNLLEDV